MSNANVVSQVEIPVAFYTVSISGKSDNANAKGLDAEIADNKGTDADAVRTLVSIIPKVYSKPITSIGGKIRNHFERNGIRLGKTLYGIPLAVLPAFKMELDKMMQEYQLHVAKLVEIAENGTLRDVVIKSAGDVANEIADKIPSADDIRNGYGVDVRVKVNFNDGNVQKAMQILSDDLKSQLRQEVEESTKKDNADKVNAVSSKIVDAVRELVKDINERCAKAEKGTQWKTMVDKVKRIVDVLPAYNVLGNPELDKMIASVREKFGKLTTEDLKESDKTREEAITNAKEIANSFANLF